MSALTGALTIALALTAEEVLVSSAGGTSAITGAFGLVSRGIARLADPTVALIPDLADKKSPTPASSTPASSTPGGVSAPGRLTSPTIVH